MLFNKAKKSGDASRLARLMLTSSDAELLGGQLYDIQGYVELVDALATQSASERTAVLATSPLEIPCQPTRSTSSAS